MNTESRQLFSHYCVSCIKQWISRISSQRMLNSRSCLCNQFTQSFICKILIGHQPCFRRSVMHWGREMKGTGFPSLRTSWCTCSMYRCRAVLPQFHDCSECCENAEEGHGQIRLAVGDWRDFLEVVPELRSKVKKEAWKRMRMIGGREAFK